MRTAVDGDLGLRRGRRERGGEGAESGLRRPAGRRLPTWAGDGGRGGCSSPSAWSRGSCSARRCGSTRRSASTSPASPSATCSRRCATTATRRSTTCCSTSGWRWSASPTSRCGRCRASSPWPRCRWPGSPGRRLAGTAGGALGRGRPGPVAVRGALRHRDPHVLAGHAAGPGRLPAADRRPRAADVARLGGLTLHLRGLLCSATTGPSTSSPRSAACSSCGRGGAPTTGRPPSGPPWPSPSGGVLFLPWVGGFLYQARPHRHTVGLAVPARPPSSRPRSWTWAAARSPRPRSTAASCWCCCLLGLFAAEPRATPSTSTCAPCPTVRWELAVSVALVIAVGAVVGYATNATFQGRYAATVVPLVLLAVAVGLTRLPRPAALVAGGVFVGLVAVRHRWGELLPAHPVGRRGRRGARPGPARRRGRVLPRPARPRVLTRDARRPRRDGLPDAGGARAGRLGRLRRAQRRGRHRRRSPRTSWPRPTGTPCSWCGCPTTTRRHPVRGPHGQPWALSEGLVRPDESRFFEPAYLTGGRRPAHG